MVKEGHMMRYVKIPEELARSWILEYQNYPDLSGYTKMLMKEIEKEFGYII